MVDLQSVEYKKKVAITTLGCKLNFAESSGISNQFVQKGYEIVDFKGPADIYIINTCSVTDNADKKCRKVIQKALKQAEGAKVVIIGCYAQLKPDEIAKIDGVDLVLGTNEKFNILDYLDQIEAQSDTITHTSTIEEVNIFNTAYSFGKRTRSFLKVQDGCDYSCSFCTIPMARGKSRSSEIKNIVESAKKIGELGVKEIVLTGVNIGDFGKVHTEYHEHTFFDLIKNLEHINSIDRFRISSIEPNLLTDDIIDFVFDSNKFMNHFHIPLQSGSNKILRLMRRRYQREMYEDLVNKIKDKMADCCIGVDIITGFPGETDYDFRETYGFINKLDISYLHVFMYSERSGTAAVKFVDSLPIAVRKERSDMLRNLSLRKRQIFYENQRGMIKEALFEKKNEDGLIKGFTDNYIKVRTKYAPQLVNQIVKVTLASLTDGEMEVEIHR